MRLELCIYVLPFLSYLALAVNVMLYHICKEYVIYVLYAESSCNKSVLLYRVNSTSNSQSQSQSQSQLFGQFNHLGSEKKRQKKEGEKSECRCRREK